MPEALFPRFGSPRLVDALANSPRSCSSTLRPAVCGNWSRPRGTALCAASCSTTGSRRCPLATGCRRCPSDNSGKPREHDRAPCLCVPFRLLGGAGQAGSEARSFDHRLPRMNTGLKAGDHGTRGLLSGSHLCHLWLKSLERFWPQWLPKVSPPGRDGRRSGGLGRACSRRGP